MNRAAVLVVVLFAGLASTDVVDPSPPPPSPEIQGLDEHNPPNFRPLHTEPPPRWTLPGLCFPVAGVAALALFFMLRHRPPTEGRPSAP